MLIENTECFQMFLKIDSHFFTTHLGLYKSSALSPQVRCLGPVVIRGRFPAQTYNTIISKSRIMETSVALDSPKLKS